MSRTDLEVGRIRKRCLEGFSDLDEPALDLVQLTPKSGTTRISREILAKSVNRDYHVKLDIDSEDLAFFVHLVYC